MAVSVFWISVSPRSMQTPNTDKHRKSLRGLASDYWSPHSALDCVAVFVR